MYRKLSILAVFIMLALVLGAGGAYADELASPPAAPLAAPLGTAFTYQGYLTDGGSPADGTYDFEFKLYDAASLGSPVGSPFDVDNATVSEGYFTVELDFGDIFDGTALWLEIGVRPGASTSSYQQMLPRQPLTAAPYALFAVDADKLDGLDSADLYTQAEVDALLAAYDARITALEDLLASVSTENGGQDVVFTGVNVHVRDGSGDTLGAVNGRGNLIVGYNSADLNPFDTDYRSGSHNLIVGDEHSYASYGGLAVGYDNVLTGIGATVTGGRNNTAGPGAFASVSGGQNNEAIGTFSTVAGGHTNTAVGASATVSGGQENSASGNYASVSGGYQRSASSNRHWVAGSLLDDNADVYVAGANVYVQNGSGVTWSTNGKGNLIIGYNSGTLIADTDVQTGSHNLVVGEDHSYTSYGGLVVGLNNNITSVWASVSGGRENTASGASASVSGGAYNTATYLSSSISGGLWNVSSGLQSSVSGGWENTASGVQSSVSGGRANIASGTGASVSGGYGNTASYTTTSVSGGSSNTVADLSSSISGGQGCTIPFNAYESGWAVGNYHTGSSCVLDNGW
jgi:hypothetical protein